MRRRDRRTVLASRGLTCLLALVAAGLLFAYLGNVRSWGAFEWGVLAFCLLFVFARFAFFRQW